MSHQLHSLLQYVCTPPDQPPGGNTEAPVLVNEAMHIYYNYYCFFHENVCHLHSQCMVQFLCTSIGKTLNRVSSQPKSPRGREKNDPIITEVEPRFPLHLSRSRPQGLFGRDDTRIQHLKNGCVRAGECWPFLISFA